MITYLDLEDAEGVAVRFHGAGAPRRKLSNVEGLPGVMGAAGARDSVTNRPSYHGSVTRSRWRKAGMVTLEGRIVAPTADQAIVELDELKVPLLDSVDTPCRLLWQRGYDGIGEELQAYARLVEDVAVTHEANGRILRFQAQLRLDDPRGYAQTQSTTIGGTLATDGGATMPRTLPVTFAQGTGGLAAVNNTGTRPTPPLFRVYGYAVDPEIVLIDHDARIVLSGTVQVGDYLEVDVADRTVTLNGSSPAQGFVDSAQTTWFELPRGTSTVRLLATESDGATRVDVLYRPAWA